MIYHNNILVPWLPMWCFLRSNSQDLAISKGRTWLLSVTMELPRLEPCSAAHLNKVEAILDTPSFFSFWISNHTTLLATANPCDLQYHIQARINQIQRLTRAAQSLASSLHGSLQETYKPHPKSTWFLPFPTFNQTTLPLTTIDHDLQHQAIFNSLSTHRLNTEVPKSPFLCSLHSMAHFDIPEAIPNSPSFFPVSSFYNQPSTTYTRGIQQ